MDILVKNTNRAFLPVLLGTDANAYGMARSFHQAYGVRSLSLGKTPLLETKHSRIVHVQTTPDFDEQEVFIRTLDEVAKTYGSYYEHLLLIACGDRYTELICNNRDLLRTRFVVPYIDRTLKERLEDKEAFYAICEQYGLDYPKTLIITPENRFDFDIPFAFPLAVKASDSIEYVALEFEGKKKSYKADTPEELRIIVRDIYNADYTGHLIVQDFIPGDDATMFVLNSYSDANGKVRAMCLGQCVLEDYTPAGIGNYNAIIQKPDADIYKQYQTFLEDIGFIGFSNFDLKYDARDGRYKVFEINIRQGRSSFFTTASGCNLATYLVDEYVNEQPKTATHYHDNPYLWLHVTKDVLLDYAPERTLPQIRRLLNEKRADHTLLYDPDKTLYRQVMINRFYMQSRKKYKQWFNKRSIND